MTDPRPKRKIQAMDIADRVAKYLTSTATEGAHGVFWTIPSDHQKGKLNWNSPENIETGGCGVVLYLLEAYRATGVRQYLESASKGLDYLLNFCHEHASTNYSFFTGRGGVAYAACRLQEISANDDLLKKAIGLMLGSEQYYLNSPHVSDSFYDGRAGTMLALLHLYASSRSTVILELIERYHEKIISNMNANASCIFWTRQQLLSEPCHNFAYGSAGIGFVYNEMFKFFGDRSCQMLSILSLKNSREKKPQSYFKMNGIAIDPNSGYEFFESRLMQDRDISWLRGSIGIETANLIAGTALNNAFDNPLQNLPCSWISAIGLSLCQGISGIGLCQIQAANNVDEIADILMQKFESQNSFDLTNGLMYGNLGMAYFLLHYGATKRYHSILFPSLPNTPSTSESGTSSALKNIDPAIISSFFGKTIALLGLDLQAQIESIPRHLLEVPVIIKSFIDSVECHLSLLESTKEKERLLDVFGLEKAQFDFTAKQRTHSYFSQYRLSEYQHLLKRLQSETWVNDAKIIQTNNFLHVFTNYDWSAKNFSDPSHYCHTESIFYWSSDGKLEQVPAVIGLLVGHFEQASTASEVMGRMKTLFLALDPLSKESLVAITGSNHYEDFLMRSENLMREQIQSLLLHEVLSICE